MKRNISIVKKKRNLFVLLISFLLPALSFVSCINDNTLEAAAGNADTESYALLSVVPQIESQPFVTRANSSTTATTKETNIKHITVLAYDNVNGYLKASTDSTFAPTATSYNVNVRVPYTNSQFNLVNKYDANKPYSSTNVIQLIAVANGNYDNLKTYTTLTSFKNAYNQIQSTADLSNSDALPMEGVAGSTVTLNATSTTPTTINLDRIVSRFDIKIKASRGVKILSYNLFNVPTSGCYYNNGSSLWNPYNTFIKTTADEAATPVNAMDSTTFSRYVYECYPGAPASTPYTMDQRSSSASYHPANALYLHVNVLGSQNNSYDFYLGGVSPGNYADFSIPRNYTFSYTMNITTTGSIFSYISVKNSNMSYSSVPNIGDYYYSDGTWGPYDATKKAIGVVFSNTPSATDQAKGWTHGYAMALKNANTTPVAWSSGATAVQSTHPATLATIAADKDGYTESQAIKTAAGANLSTQYPVFYYALNYGTSTLPATSQYAAPASTNNSGWYLPSCGQWYDILVNLGQMTTMGTVTTTYFCWAGGYDTSGNAYTALAANNINTNYLAKVSSDVSVVDKFQIPSSGYNSYGSSTEYNATSVYLAEFGSYPNAYLYLEPDSKTTAASYSYPRPVIAF